MKTTKWFKPSVKPVHVGMYQTRCDMGNIYWRYWNGKFWGWGYCNKRDAYGWRNKPNGIQDEQWRGLTRRAR